MAGPLVVVQAPSGLCRQEMGFCIFGRKRKAQGQVGLGAGKVWLLQRLLGRPKLILCTNTLDSAIASQANDQQRFHLLPFHDDAPMMRGILSAAILAIERNI